MPHPLADLVAILQNREASRQGQPLFTEEGPEHLAAALKHNLPFATKGPFQTALAPHEEAAFRTWVAQNKVPFDPEEKMPDYDMRGFWKAQQTGQTEPWKGQGSHFPDTFKTPADTTFSAESKYAKKAPFVWKGNDLIDLSTGQLIFRSK
jgi:hypothetical protein